MPPLPRSGRTVGAASHPHLSDCAACRDALCRILRLARDHSRRCHHRGGRALPGRTPRGPAGADFPAPRSGGTARAGHCVPDVHAAVDLAHVARVALDCRRRGRRPHRRCRRRTDDGSASFADGTPTAGRRRRACERPAPARSRDPGVQTVSAVARRSVPRPSSTRRCRAPRCPSCGPRRVHAARRRPGQVDS